jgi:ABC-2 type transport system permease protein
VSAEFLKVWYLPFPRWIGLTLAAVVVAFGLGLYVASPSDTFWYVETPGSTIGLVARVAVLIFGVWVATLDFASGTAQRTFVAEPSRNRVLATKFLIVLVVAAIVALAVAAATAGLSELAARHSDVDIDEGDLAAATFGQAPSVVTASAIGFGLGLLSRSLAAGIALGIVFLLVLDGIISLIPRFEDYAYGLLVQDLDNGITGVGETTNSLGVAIVGVLVWVLVILVPGWIRVLRMDLK